MNSLQQIQLPEFHPLLKTKLALPRLRLPLVPRQRLLARLDAGFERKLSLVSAPAGFGKTTLVCQWIAGHGTQARRLPVAWVSLDTGDNDPIRFWRYLIMACQAFDRNVGRSSLASLQPSAVSGLQSWHANLMQPSIDAVLDSFLNEISQIPEKSILVLEDYHLIATQSIHTAVAKLIGYLPPSLHLVIITRSDPPLPLARLRAQDDLVELHAVELSFSHEETIEFLRQSVPFAVSAETIERLETRSEGWGAGMRLLALALQKQGDSTEIEASQVALRGSRRHLLEYFVTEVLEAQPGSIQDFLLRTSLLPRLTGALCDAVAGRDDSGQLLAALERAGLFLLPLDDSGEWYRYHALFAEAVRHEARSRLGEAVVSGCYLRASTWYELNGMLPEAVDASLSAGEYSRAASLIESIAATPRRHERDGLFTLQRWLEQLPDAVLHANPALCFLYANALVFLSISNQLPKETLRLVEKVLALAEQAWQSSENLPGIGEIFAFHSLLAFRQGEPARAADLARRALGWLPAVDEYASSRVICLSIIGNQHREKGDFDAARQKFLEALGLTDASGNLPGKRVILNILGELCLTRGELHRAADYFQLVLSLAGEDITDRQSALLGLSRVSYEWNDLESAEGGAREVLQTATQFSDENLRVRSGLALTRLLRAQKKVQEAQNLLDELGSQVEASGQPFLRREVVVSQVDLQLSLGNVAAASRWVARSEAGDETLPLLLKAQEGLLTARAWMLLGETQKATQTLEKWMQIALGLDYPRMILEILLLQSLNYNASGQEHKAKELIRSAISGAYPEGYRRLFLDHGQPALRVLRSVIADIPERHLFAYLRSLLQEFASEVDTQTLAGPEITLVEPLSLQELRVLRLLEAGFTRQEIARELVVSTNTVKTHLLHIYHKLNVTSRSEAIEAARGLFSQ